MKPRPPHYLVEVDTGGCMGSGDMAWVGHWLDTPFLSPLPHPQTATMSGWSMGAWVQCVLYGSDHGQTSWRRKGSSLFDQKKLSELM